MSDKLLTVGVPAVLFRMNIRILFLELNKTQGVKTCSRRSVFDDVDECKSNCTILVQV